MENHVKIFPELGGFAVFCESLLIQETNSLDIKSDLLSYLSNNSESEELTKKGLIFPINEIEDGLYTIHLEKGGNNGGQKFISDGNLSICGIGYLTDFNIIKITNNKKLIKLPLEIGEYILSWKVDTHHERLTIIYSKTS
ncbi:hypothetical protein MADA3029_p0065 [Vibrio nigripulchritudo MADA3029]|uniref:hypothetical protein n=1 Tax=Vibrio nigripulchritudo TaxID=28173 RepID=UPI0003B1B13C|nr:hypothetical protein [Vibrio nigripulchritudo]CCN50832.1 hypothetical protein VIBNIMADA3020_p0065 [Vibrio nigripulchritudo MADA3020]CCN56690.1 hypothetical protein VIBNIMADA3021_p0065 [Vibrio nigripulchritudo MADA3021]CCN62547.1 hypothetical protein MADA3029_p0065 [Vibrio nigripulchritudo MADA3029]